MTTGFSERLRGTLLNLGYNERGMATRLSQDFGVSVKAATKWLNGESLPQTSKIALMSLRYQVDSDWLLTGREAVGDRELKPQGELRKVPVLTYVQAGRMKNMNETLLVKTSEIPEWLTCPAKHGPRTFCLKVEGDSMTAEHGRSYPEGSYIYVDPDRAHVNGSRVIAIDPQTNEPTFKVYSEDSGRKFLKPLNPRYPIINLVDDADIVGVVIGSYQVD